MFERGFTGHEHYDKFGIIDMNGRCYDPAVGRFFSADPGIQDPGLSQCFNRYSYCLNNPVNFVDPGGFNMRRRIGTSMRAPGSSQKQILL